MATKKTVSVQDFFDKWLITVGMTFGATYTLEVDALEGEWSLRVDPDHVREALVPFWQDLHAVGPGFIQLTSGFLVGARLRGVERRRFAWPDESAAAVTWVVNQALLARDVYHSPNLMMGRKGNRTICPSFVFAEVDHTKLSKLPAPSLVVRSSPNRMQCFWKTSEPVSDATATTLGKRLRSDRDQLLVVPGTRNNMYHGAPRVDIVESNSSSNEIDDLMMNLPEIHPDPLFPTWRPDAGHRGEWLTGPLTLVTSTAGRAIAAGALAAVVAVGAVLIPKTNKWSPSDIASAFTLPSVDRSGQSNQEVAKITPAPIQIQSSAAVVTQKVTVQRAPSAKTPVQAPPVGVNKEQGPPPQPQQDQVGSTLTQGGDTSRSWSERFIDVVPRIHP